MKRLPVLLLAPAVVALLAMCAVYFGDPELSETRRSLVEGGATLVGVLVAAAMIVWQQRDAARTQVILGRYEHARSALTVAQDRVGDFAGFVRFLPASITLQIDQIQAGEQTVPIRARFPEYQRLWRESTHAVANSMDAVGSCEMLMPDAKILREALACAQSDVERHTTDLVMPLIHSLPMDGPNGTILNPGPMPEVLRERVTALAGKLLDRLMDLQCYLDDANVDLSNRLVGDLFKASQNRRQPADPRLLVLSTEAAQIGRVRSWLSNHPLMQRHAAYTNLAAAQADRETV